MTPGSFLGCILGLKGYNIITLKSALPCLAASLLGGTHMGGLRL